jgi:putative membrane protein
MTALESAFPSWQFHGEVWFLVLVVLGFGLYVDRVIQPKAVAAGGAPITAAQKRWFFVALFFLWLGSDWPLHDVSEERLYSAHMFQHMIFTVVFPPALLLSVPEWLGRLIVGQGSFSKVFFWLVRPIQAAVLFNVLAAISHWNALVNLSIDSGSFHYLLHAMFVLSAFMIWTPVCGPFPEAQLGEPGKMIYIFLISIIPTIPAAFLTVSEGVIYDSYDHGPRLWIEDAIQDQQFAGVVMKVIEGAYLWGIILFIFARWMSQANPEKKKFRGTLVTSGRPPS